MWYFSKGPAGPPKNGAFVFVKPHAVTDKTNKTARDRLIEKGLKITGEGDIKSEVIDSKKLIDQHYYAIASKATILTPDQVNVAGSPFWKGLINWFHSIAVYPPPLRNYKRELGPPPLGPSGPPRKPDKLWPAKNKNVRLGYINIAFNKRQNDPKHRTPRVFKIFHL